MYRGHTEHPPCSPIFFPSARRFIVLVYSFCRQNRRLASPSNSSLSSTRLLPHIREQVLVSTKSPYRLRRPAGRRRGTASPASKFLVSSYLRRRCESGCAGHDALTRKRIRRSPPAKGVRGRADGGLLDFGTLLRGLGSCPRVATPDVCAR